MIAGLVALGRQPVCALAAPDTGKGRLRRILDLIARCDLSIHDLSRVQRARGVPRFNMPFELGLCCAVARFRRGHRYYVFEEQRHRLSKSLSDLGGYDPQVHGGTPRGIARALLNCLGTTRRAPTIGQMTSLGENLEELTRRLKREHEVNVVFEPHLFRLLVGAATELARQEGLIA